MDGRELSGHVLIYDDDHFYMGSVMAEKLVSSGCQVTIVTPAPHFAGFSHFSLEIGHIHRRMAELGVQIEAQTGQITGMLPAATLTTHPVTIGLLARKAKPKSTNGEKAGGNIK